MFDWMLAAEVSEISEIVSKLVGTIGGVTTAILFLFQYRRANIDKSLDLSRRLLDTLFSDTLSRDALRMLDWKARTYTLPTAERVGIGPGTKERGLRVCDPGSEVDWNFSPEEQYVRDCFERLYDQLDILENFVRRGLLDMCDLRTPLEYYAKLALVEPSQIAFMQAYGYTASISFLRRAARPPEAGQ